MKKLTLLLLCCLTSLATWAVKADPKPVTITQPDGTQLTIRLNGDEDLHWYSTIDGILLVQKDMAYYVAQVNADGSLSATTTLAHTEDLRTDAEKALIAAQNKETFQKKAPVMKSKRMARRLSLPESSLTSLSPSTSASPSYFPHVGSPKVLVILVDFQDVKFTLTDPVASFGDYLNGSSPFENRGHYENLMFGSVREYFTDMSKGKFSPQFDIYGPVTLSKNSAYYGGSSSDGSDDKAHDLVNEACNLVNSTVDFSQYDSNNDGKVDLVYVVYAGYAQSHNGSPNNTIWPKSGTYSGKTYDGKQVCRYGVSNELNSTPSDPQKAIEGIGLFCHEFSHTLGLPDLYGDSNATKIDNQAMERWDLMDEGEYLDDGYTPIAYSPWEREVMGWTTIETLSGAQRVEMKPDEYYKIVQNADNQYLTIQNVQHLGWFFGLPKSAHGLLISRIDYQKSTVNSTDYPNNTAGVPGITIVPADGKLLTSFKLYSWSTTDIGYGMDAAGFAVDEHGNRIPVGKDDYHCYSPSEYWQSFYGDPFPGRQNVTQLLSVNLNRGVTISDQPLYKITEDTESGIIAFNFIDEDIATNIHSIIEKTAEGDNRIFTLDGRYIGTSKDRLQKGIYIVNGKKVVVK